MDLDGPCFFWLFSQASEWDSAWVSSLSSTSPWSLSLTPPSNFFYFEWSPPWHFKTCLDIYSDILPNILSDIYSDIIFGILFVIYSDSLSEIYSDILCGILSDIYSDILSVCLGLAVRVRQGTLRSCDCSWVRWGTLWSWACCSGSAGNTAI